MSRDFVISTSMAKFAVVVVQALHKMKKTLARISGEPSLSATGRQVCRQFLDSFFLRHHGLAFSAAKVGMISDCGGGFEP